MINAASVKDRLKNIGRNTGKNMGELLVMYGLERTIYRISVSPYADKFTLKGGIFLYAVFDGDFVRMTTDIDLLAQKISNDVIRMKAVFTDILSQENEDPLKYDISSLEVVPITEFKKYHGVKVSLIAYLDRTRIPVSIDIGFSDTVYPERVRMQFPSVFGEKGPSVFAYSLESCIAEKYEALVSLGYDNSRFKDYYDIHVLATTHDFEGEKLQGAITETFKHRNTSLQNTIVAFEDDFTTVPIRVLRWNSFVKKKKAIVPVEFAECVEMIQLFLLPVVNAINNGEVFTSRWASDIRQWIE